MNVWVDFKTEFSRLFFLFLPFFSGFLFAFNRVFFIILHGPQVF